MGLFDHVSVSGPEFVCSNGHDLTHEEFQSKDFGCTMGYVVIRHNIVLLDSGGWGESISLPLIGRFRVYCSCRQCPAFVQADTFNLVACPVEFELTVVADAVQRTERVSPSTSDWLRDTPTQSWMRDCRGPMPYAEAEAIHRGRR